MRRFSVCCALLLTTSLMLAACGSTGEGPTSWLDRPLDGAKLPLAPVTIQAHASDLDGVASIQFLVDDTPLVTTSAGGGRLGTAMVEWNPTLPGTYTIKARGVDAQGNVGSDAIVVVTVGSLPQASPTASTPPGAGEEVSINFEADRTNIQRGECTTLRWSVRGGFGVELNGQAVDRSGQAEVCLEETTAYRLAVDAGTRMEQSEIVITVSEAPAVTPSPTYPGPAATATLPVPTGTSVPPTATVPAVATPTTPPPPPTIVSLQASPSSITQGQCTTVSWAVEGAITAVYLEREGVGDHDSRERCPAQTRNFTLRAVGPGGETTANVTVTVTQPQPTPTQPFSADLAITDLRAEPPSLEVRGDLTNRGPSTISDETVQLSCQWDEHDPIEGTHNTGQMGPMPIYIGNLSPGQTLVFNTDITVHPGQYDVDFSCSMQVPFNDPNLGNNSYSEQGW